MRQNKIIWDSGTMGIVGLFLTCVAALCAGCAVFGSDSDEKGYVLLVSNKADGVLQDVIVSDTDGKRRLFGYVGRRGEKDRVVNDCRIPFKEDFVILWYHDGNRHVKKLDLSGYAGFEDKIALVSFVLKSGGQWSVTAVDAAGQKIKPRQ